LVYRVFGCFSAREFKNTTTNILQKNSVEKFLQKNRQNNPNPMFSWFSFITFLGVSRWGEFKKTIKKYQKNISDPGLFWPLTHLPTTGVTEPFFCRPLEGHLFLFFDGPRRMFD
jgi:hypothetical protein